MKTKNFTWGGFEEIGNVVCKLNMFQKFVLKPKTEDRHHSYKLCYSHHTKEFTIYKNQGFSGTPIFTSPYIMDIAEAALDLNLIPVGVEQVVISCNQ